jgi:hypothetical protein
MLVSQQQISSFDVCQMVSRSVLPIEKDNVILTYSIYFGQGPYEGWLSGNLESDAPQHSDSRTRATNALPVSSEPRLEARESRVIRAKRWDVDVVADFFQPVEHLQTPRRNQLCELVPRSLSILNFVAGDTRQHLRCLQHGKVVAG